MRDNGGTIVALKLIEKWGWFWCLQKDLPVSHFNHLPIYLFLLYGSGNKLLVYFQLNDAMETGLVSRQQSSKRSVLESLLPPGPGAVPPLLQGPSLCMVGGGCATVRAAEEGLRQGSQKLENKAANY